MSKFHIGDVHIHRVQRPTMIREIEKEEREQGGPIDLDQVPGPLRDKLVGISEPGLHIGMWADKVVFAVQITYVDFLEQQVISHADHNEKALGQG